MQLCLFSISYAGLWGQHRLGLTELFAKAAELGFDSVMLAGKRPRLSPLDYSTPSSAASEKADSTARPRMRCARRCGAVGVSRTSIGARRPT